MRGTCRSIICALMVAGLAAVAPADVIYNESVSGDLSNSGLAPTVLTVSPGSNELFGTTGKNSAGVVDRDYFSLAVPNGSELSSLVLMPGTQTLGPLGASFIGIEAGPQVTVSTSATDATGLLGWVHYDTGDIGMDILPLIGSSGLGATDFTPPLPAGTYSFWVQEASVGSVNYGFDFVITPTPEPKSWTLLVAGLILLGIRSKRLDPLYRTLCGAVGAWIVSTPAGATPFSMPLACRRTVKHRSGGVFRGAAAFAAVTIVPTGFATEVQAAQWQVSVGAESPDRGSQALAFLPNELWIQAIDSILFTFPTHERPTLTLLTPGQIRPPAFGPTFGVPVRMPGPDTRWIQLRRCHVC